MSDKPAPPNLDLIRMVERARMLHDAEAVPSKTTAVYWIEAVPDTPAQQPTPRSGCWLIVTEMSQVDAQWAAVKAATRGGRLGFKSKVSTAPRVPTGRDQRVIYVCTYDRRDSDDVERIRAALVELGLRPSHYE